MSTTTIPAGQVKSIESLTDFDSFVSSSTSASGIYLSVIQFTASWDEPATAMVSVLETLAKSNTSARFGLVDADKSEELTEKYKIESVPTFLFFKDGKLVDTLEGAAVAQLTSLVTKHSRPPLIPVSIANSSISNVVSSTNPDDIDSRLTKLVSYAPVMLFMKGTPTAPKCGFSRQIAAILNENHVQYQYFDILSDQQVRDGLKTKFNWPTFPQLYVNGSLIGGLDIVKELVANGEFIGDTIPETSLTQQSSKKNIDKPKSIKEKIETLLNSSPVIIFIKGTRTSPNCGFSKTACSILSSYTPSIEYTTFDILSDNDIREGLKEYSNWPTYPQLYIKGELIGGVDLMKELNEGGELEGMLREATKEK